MMKTYLILLLFAALLTSCGKDYYNIATKTLPAKDYTIYEVHDSSIVVVPLEFRNELTPEVIREYGKTISYDSLTRLHKIPGATSIGSAIALGSLTGIIVGGIIGYASYKPPDCTWFCIDFGPGFDALGGAVVGIIPGGILGFLLRPSEEDLLPKIRSHHD
jgi:hypothetical protein